MNTIILLSFVFVGSNNAISFNATTVTTDSTMSHYPLNTIRGSKQLKIQQNSKKCKNVILQQLLAINSTTISQRILQKNAPTNIPVAPTSAPIPAPADPVTPPVTPPVAPVAPVTPVPVTVAPVSVPVTVPQPIPGVAPMSVPVRVPLSTPVEQPVSQNIPPEQSEVLPTAASSPVDVSNANPTANNFTPTLPTATGNNIVPGSSSTTTPNATSSSSLSTGAIVGIIVGVIVAIIIGFFVIKNNKKKNQSINDTPTTNANNKTSAITVRKINDNTTTDAAAVVATVPKIKTMNHEIVPSQNEVLLDSVLIDTDEPTTNDDFYSNQLSDDNDTVSGVKGDSTSNASRYTVPTRGRTTISSKSGIDDNLPLKKGSKVSGNTTSGRRNTTVLSSPLPAEYKMAAEYDKSNKNNDDKEKTLFSSTDASEF